jgi:hypothetical protein
LILPEFRNKKGTATKKVFKTVGFIKPKQHGVDLRYFFVAVPISLQVVFEFKIQVLP